MTTENSELVLIYRTSKDYSEDRILLEDLFKRCESINQTSSAMSMINKSSSVAFHCEFTDYLWCMEQYHESYCCQLREPKNEKIIAVYIVNMKHVYFGDNIMSVAFGRLARVDPNRRRQRLFHTLFSSEGKAWQQDEVDFFQGYTLFTNFPSLALQREHTKIKRNELASLDIFVIPTQSNTKTASLHELTSAEMEQLYMIDLADWICRPVLEDLRRIMNMQEYIGTFAIGDFTSGQYTLASVWQPSSSILCDDRFSQENVYRGPYWLIFNFFQLPDLISSSSNDKQYLLSSLSDMAFKRNIPFLLCHVERSSVFNHFCRRNALAMTTEILSTTIFSQRMLELGDEFDKSPVWLDPRDFSSLLYFTSSFEHLSSQL